MPHLNYSLFETMLVVQDKIFLLLPHLERLYKSALQLGFDYQRIESFLSSYDYSADNTTLKHKQTLQNSSHTTNQDFLQILQKFFHDSTNTPTTSPQQRVLTPNTFRNFTSLWGSITMLKELFDTYNIIYKEPDRQTSLNYILRITLQQDGGLFYQTMPLLPLINYDTFLYPTPLDSQNIMLSHKTTQREHFKEAAQKITQNLCFDYIYVNSDNQITEGSRSNILIQSNAYYYTPHSSSGLLRGTLREILLQHNLCQEKILVKQDLQNADSIFCINSVRGIVQVNWKHGRDNP
ncbi:hypothetical protein CQA66_05965 [Helicobacter aurati]|uniref:branched-chain-amino-acid transaminase n=1 Tax=Helicobacter aurati TaxID=137778 RepID=A0A3D8J3B9_9HELI|nr:aminotransferase class IV [Helicobacter aurati]RDU71645.1 hypothetical protein CQA66_05965 [Helicobacter aurati]